MVHRREFIGFALGVASVVTPSVAQATASKRGKMPFENPALAPQERARDLVARMSVEEQIAQLQCPPAADIVKDPAAFERDNPYFRFGVGGAFRLSQNLGPTANARAANAFQQLVCAKSRFAIPALICTALSRRVLPHSPKPSPCHRAGMKRWSNKCTAPSPPRRSRAARISAMPPRSIFAAIRAGADPRRLGVKTAF
jgi:hypothetical protein